jgi:phospholipid transport system transporter-binding protein
MQHKLTGRLDMNSCAEQAVNLTSIMRQHNALMLDFSEVSAADSAALALILELHRQAQATGQSLSLIGLSDDLRSLATLYGVETLLEPLEGAAP